MNIQEIKAEYRDHMGSDLMVVNAARASFGKESDWDHSKTWEETLSTHTDVMDNGIDYRKVKTRTHMVLKEADANLIRFLATGFRTKDWESFLDKVIDRARHGSRDELTKLLHDYKRKPQHWAPFGHPHVHIRIAMPIFLARQFVKHQVGGVWSEESRRYVCEEPGVWFPKEWHNRPEDIKQGAGEVITHMEWNDGGDVEQEEIGPVMRELTQHQVHAYTQMVAGGVAPEEARIMLPLNMMTTVVWTGSLLFWARVCNQRVDSHAQLAAQELGKKIAAIVAPLYPVSWEALTGMKP